MMGTRALVPEALRFPLGFPSVAQFLVFTAPVREIGAIRRKNSFTEEFVACLWRDRRPSVWIREGLPTPVPCLHGGNRVERLGSLDVDAFGKVLRQVRQVARILDKDLLRLRQAQLLDHSAHGLRLTVTRLERLNLGTRAGACPDRAGEVDINKVLDRGVCGSDPRTPGRFSGGDAADHTDSQNGGQDHG